MKCPMCEKAELKIKKKEFEMHGIKLGVFETEVCSSCREEFFDEETSKKINEKAKKLGLWGLFFKTKVTKSGNALAVRISKKITKFSGLKLGEEVVVYPKDKHKIIIEH